MKYTPRSEWNKVFFVDEDGDIFYRKTGKIATHSHGKYLRVAVNHTKYYAHHIVWFLAYNKWPERDIDHRDGDCCNNRLSNLREATMSQNIANSLRYPTRGIEKHGRRWRARIHVDWARIELGSFETREEAVNAYKVAADKHFGEFAFHNR